MLNSSALGIASVLIDLVRGFPNQNLDMEDDEDGRMLQLLSTSVELAELRAKQRGNDKISRHTDLACCSISRSISQTFDLSRADLPSSGLDSMKTPIHVPFCSISYVLSSCWVGS